MLRSRYLFIGAILLAGWFCKWLALPSLVLPVLAFILLFRLTLVEALTILVLTELYNGLDTVGLGPFSFVQIASVMLLLALVKSGAAFRRDLLRSSHFVFICLAAGYFFVSFLNFHKHISLGPLNWILIYVLVFAAVRDVRTELPAIKSMFNSFMCVVLTYNLVVLLAFYPDINAAKAYLMFNPNHLGFYVLISLVFSAEEFVNRGVRKKAGLMWLMLMEMVFLVISGGRLNLAIFVILYFSLLVRRDISIVNARSSILIGLIGLGALLTGPVSSLIFRNSEGREWNLSRVDFREDSQMSAFTSGRSLIYADGFDSFLKRPLLGLGYLSWNNINNTDNSFLSSTGTSRLSMHSTHLQMLAETGVVGYLLYLAWMFRFWKTAFANQRVSSEAKRVHLRKLIPIIFLLGGVLDNHSIAYGIFHFFVAIELILHLAGHEKGVVRH